MANLSDKKPVACAGDVMRRSNSHVLGNNKVAVQKTGDSHHRFPMFNVAQTTYPDSDERWGLDPCDPDYPTD